MNQDLAMQVTINITKDGKLSVSGFPNNLQGALQVIHGASDAIVQYFIGKAKAGEMDDQGNVVESKIMKPDILINPVGIPVGTRGSKYGLFKK